MPVHWTAQQLRSSNGMAPLPQPRRRAIQQQAVFELAAIEGALRAEEIREAAAAGRKRVLRNADCVREVWPDRLSAYRFSRVMLTSRISVPGDRIRIDCRLPRVVSVKFAVNTKLWMTAWTWRPLLSERP
jgi:hypothetical protein